MSTAPADFTVAKSPPPADYEEDSHAPGHGNVLYMNLTPMIDMVFNLLFFFVMASGQGQTTLFLQSRLPDTGGQGAGAAANVDHLVIRVDEVFRGANAGQPIVSVQGLAFSDYNALSGKLEELRATFGPERSVQIQVAGYAGWKHAVNAKNAASRAGFQKVAFSEWDNSLGPPSAMIR